MANLKLPKVVLERGNYRFVAVEETAQAESFHAEKIVVNIGTVKSPVHVKIVPEKKNLDSLGGESWSRCNSDEAVKVVIVDLLREELQSEDKRASQITKKNQSV